VYVSLLSSFSLSLSHSDLFSLSFANLNCYTDSISSRTFLNNLGSTHWDIETCLALASAGKYAYAGLEWHGECWVRSFLSSTSSCLSLTLHYSQGANDISAPGKVQDASACTLLCNENNLQQCGGDSAIDVYKSKTWKAPTVTTTSAAPTATVPTTPAYIAPAGKYPGPEWTCSSLLFPFLPVSILTPIFILSRRQLLHRRQLSYPHHSAPRR
jgi:hypothetical protein